MIERKVRPYPAGMYSRDRFTRKSTGTPRSDTRSTGQRLEKLERANQELMSRLTATVLEKTMLQRNLAMLRGEMLRINDQTTDTVRGQTDCAAETEWAAACELLTNAGTSQLDLLYTILTDGPVSTAEVANRLGLTEAMELVAAMVQCQTATVVGDKLVATPFGQQFADSISAACEDSRSLNPQK
jgi:hypothetical protein